MSVNVSLYSNKDYEINKFLKSYNKDEVLDSNSLEWTKEFKNPIEVADIIGVFIDNNDKFNINMWLSLDENFFINITNYNADKIIRYLFERYPY